MSFGGWLPALKLKHEWPDMDNPENKDKVRVFFDEVGTAISSSSLDKLQALMESQQWQVIRKYMKQQIGEVVTDQFSQVIAGNIQNARNSLMWIAVVTGGVFAVSMTASRVFSQYGIGVVQSWFEPTLAIEKGRGKSRNGETSIFLNAEAEQELAEAIAVLEMDQENMVKPNLLFYGPPGTGKTGRARQLTRDIGLDFLMVSGSSWFSMSMEKAIAEMDKMFLTLRSLRKTTMVFIDEADILLMNRDMLTPEQSKLITHFLTHTGDLSREYFFVFATNRADVIDPALASRITYTVHFDLPDAEARGKILRHYFAEYIENGNGFFDRDQVFSRMNACINRWQELTKGFSGRDLKTLVLRFKWMLMAASSRQSPVDVERMIEETISKIKKKKAGLEGSLQRRSAD